MPGFRHVVRCAQCGHLAADDIGFNSRCSRCGADLHSCAQCASFDPSSRFECMQTIAERVSPKNTRNGCTLFAPRTTVERETDHPAEQRCAKSIRRPLQLLNAAYRRGSDTVGLLSDRDRQVVGEQLAAIRLPVTLLCSRRPSTHQKRRCSPGRSWTSSRA
jgi:hypothetical protein